MDVLDAALKKHAPLDLVLIMRNYLSVDDVFVHLENMNHDDAVRYIRTATATGYNINAQDEKSKRTLLHYAVAHGKMAVTQALITTGAHPDILDSNSQTPLHSTWKQVDQLCRNGKQVFIDPTKALPLILGGASVCDTPIACKKGKISHREELYSLALQPQYSFYGSACKMIPLIIEAGCQQIALDADKARKCLESPDIQDFALLAKSSSDEPVEVYTAHYDALVAGYNRYIEQFEKLSLPRCRIIMEVFYSPIFKLRLWDKNKCLEQARKIALIISDCLRLDDFSRESLQDAQVACQLFQEDQARNKKWSCTVS